MTVTLKALRALADPTRLRLTALLAQDELSVHELQAVTHLGQSRISTHLGLLVDNGILQSRREGKRIYYRRKPDGPEPIREVVRVALAGAPELATHVTDQANLRRVLNLRQAQEQVFFNQVAGRFDRSYGPGRSWQALGQLLLRILPPITVADLGSGEGLVSELLARRCKKVIAVDNSEKIVEFGAARAARAGLKNLEFRLGDLEQPPIDKGSVDLVILSQALHHATDPSRAIQSAHAMLRPGGQLMVLDLLRHNFEAARELYGDVWLGFVEGELERWLEAAGFTGIEITVVAREEQPPYFQTVLAAARR